MCLLFCIGPFKVEGRIVQRLREDRYDSEILSRIKRFTRSKVRVYSDQTPGLDYPCIFAE